MKHERACPNAHPLTPHTMREDKDGRWYCPIERRAKLEAEQNARQAEIDELEALFALPGTDKEN